MSAASLFRVGVTPFWLGMQASSLTTANKLLQEELAAARKAIHAGAASAAEGVVAESETSNAIIKDLRMRIENQAEYIRSQNSKMSDLEQKLVIFAGITDSMPYALSFCC
jgi:hypothetical protein